MTTAEPTRADDGTGTTPTGTGGEQPKTTPAAGRPAGEAPTPEKIPGRTAEATPASDEALAPDAAPDPSPALDAAPARPAEPDSGPASGAASGRTAHRPTGPAPNEAPDAAPDPASDEAPAPDAAPEHPAEPDSDPASDNAPETPPDQPPALAKDLRSRVLRHPVLLTGTVAGAVHLLWFFFFANSGGDIAAQDAWAEFVGRHPDSAYNLAWYGGMHPVSYSVVSPYLMSLLGVRTTMMVVGTVSAALTSLILYRVKAVRNPLACSFAGVFAFLCNALSGRVTFGLGTMFALGAVAAVFCWPYRWRYRRWAKAVVAAPLAGLATAASPVAGLFLGVVAAALFLNKRRPGAYAVGLAPVAVVGLSAWLFPFSGTQPMSPGTASLPILFSVVTFFLVPRSWHTVRTAAAVYGIGVLLTWVIDSQIGSNVSRLAMIVGGVVLLAALPYTAPRTRKWYALALAFVALNFWIGFKGVDDIVRTAPTASWARELAPLVNELQEVGAERGRVEVVPASSHREASALAPYVNLARGWNRQADMERNPLFYDDSLTDDSYRAWLDRWAVRYVVLPEGRPDNGADREAELVQRGLPYLNHLWGDDNWQLYEVQDPMPLADPPAVVRRASADELTIEVKSAGRVLIRIPYSRWLALVDEKGESLERPAETAASKADEDGPKRFTNPNGCLFRAEKNTDGDEWTELLAPHPGTYRVSAPYQLRPGTPCPDELRDEG